MGCQFGQNADVTGRRCQGHSFLGHMNFLGKIHYHLLLLTRPCFGGEGTVRENVTIFSLDY